MGLYAWLWITQVIVYSSFGFWIWMVTGTIRVMATMLIIALSIVSFGWLIEHWHDKR